ncbi:patatin-like phospholipase family protein [Tahibacter amnicola]|uniref:Patatin-like phospholipase family protein n=1 Tax=Tahibacter amnicola TaxID=2976241 RepID=A0ABY6B9G6_9GAMM|nr:patatin-like phospholipase family protein [Tahibacter amnicola]UXI66664.1 patatin-like phospholipase family protein [Tahibacter amnicola]
MLVVQAASKPRKRTTRARIGLAVAGGGPIGGMYELGALRAIEEAVTGLDLTDLDVYVGVSSGAFLAAGLANLLDTAEMCRIFLTGQSDQARFHPEVFVRPAMFEYLRRAIHMPRMIVDWVGAVARNPLEFNVSDSLMRLGSLLPTGLFDNGAIESFLREMFTTHGRSNDFRELQRRLYVIAVELDSGREVRFGAPGHDDVPISVAIEASAALPGLYPPVKIGSKYYVDGALQRTLHASVALDQGADLVIGINPLVPFDAAQAHASGAAAPGSLIEGGLPAVLSQTFRTMLQSRMQASVSRYARHYDSADVVLFEPNADDVKMFFTNVFSYANRQQVAEHAYRSTLADLRARREVIEPILQRNGLAFDEAVMSDTHRTLHDGLAQPRPAGSPTTSRLRYALDELDGLIEKGRAASRQTRPQRSEPRKPARRRARKKPADES